MNIFQKVGQKLASILGESDEIDEWILKEDSGADKMLKHNFFSDLLPYKRFNEETGIFENKESYGFVFEIFPNIVNAKTAEDELRILLKELFLPSASIQVLLFADPFIGSFLDSWKERTGEKGEVFQTLAKKRADFFEQEVLLENSPLGSSPRNFRRIFSFSAPKNAFSKKLLEKKLQTFKRKASSVFSQLGEVKEFVPDDLIALCNNMIGMDQTIHPQKSQPFQNIGPIHEHIHLGGVIDVESNFLMFRKKRNLSFKSLQVTNYPTDWGLSFSSSLIGDFFQHTSSLPSPFFIQYGLSFLDQQKEEISLLSKNKLLRQQFRISGILRKKPDLVEESEEHDSAMRASSQGEKFIGSRMTVGLFALPEHFEDYQNRLKSLFRSKGFSLEESHFFHLDDFVKSLPMVWGESPYGKDIFKTRVFKTTMTTEAPLFFPLLAEGNGNASNGLLLLGRRGQLSFFDNFSTSSGTNMTILGSTGKGKSVLLGEMIKDRVGRGGRAFVFDKGKSFENLCGHFNGKHICFSKDSSLYLNPFSFIEKGESVLQDLSMVFEIFATMAMLIEGIDIDKKAILKAAVAEIFLKKGTSATVDDLINTLKRPTQENDEHQRDAASLVLRLRIFSSKGEYAQYFFGEKHLSLKDDLIIFEMQELSALPDLRAVIIQIFAFLISKEVLAGSREKKSLIILDEAHALLNSPQMEFFCSSWAKEVRKYGAALVCCTQDYFDIQKSPGAKTIYSNSNFLVVMGQDDNLLTELREKEGGEQVEDFIKVAQSLRKTGDYSELLIRDKDKKSFALYRLRLDPFSILLFSSNAKEFAAMERLKKEGLSIEDTVDWLSPLRKEFNNLIGDDKVSVEKALEFLKTQHPLIAKEKEVFFAP